MIHIQRRLNLICWAFALAVLLLGSSARAERVVLQLQNGDRIAGTIVSENADSITVSTTWIKELAIPKSQIQWRATPPAEITGTNIATAITNFVANTAPGTNAIPAVTNALATGTAVTSTNISGTNVTVIVGTNVVVEKHGKTTLVAVSTNTGPPSWWKRWKGEAAVGMDLEKGSVDHELYYARAKATYSQPYKTDTNLFFRNALTYDAAYGKTAGVLSDNRMGGTSKTDFDMNPRVYLYNLGAGFYDQVRKIDLHYEDGPGAGYHLFKGTNFSANVEAGANYQVEYRSDNTNTASFYYRFGEDLTWKWNKLMTFTEKAEISPRATSFEQFRSRIECNLSYSLIYNFSLNFTFIDLYDTQPAAGVPNNDLQFRTSLGVKF